MNDDEQYERVDPPSPMRNCACCGSSAELWKYRANPDSLEYVPGCSQLEAFGFEHRSECPMYELRHLYRSTKREAVRDWNAFNDELKAKRGQPQYREPTIEDAEELGKYFHCGMHELHILECLNKAGFVRKVLP